MTLNSRRIAAIVMKIQTHFLNAPELTLTLLQARQRFDIDETTCEAVLSTLVDASVLAKSPDGNYRRFFPRLGSRTAVGNQAQPPRRQKSVAAQPAAGFAA